MTMAISHAEGTVAVLDLVRERKPPFSPDEVVKEFAATLAKYGITKIVGDRSGSGFVGEAFLKAGLTYEPSEKPKSDLYRELLPLLNSKRAELLDLPRLRAQLIGLERKTPAVGAIPSTMGLGPTTIFVMQRPAPW